MNQKRLNILIILFFYLLKNLSSFVTIHSLNVCHTIQLCSTIITPPKVDKPVKTPKIQPVEPSIPDGGNIFKINRGM
jgi:hypothetical protein